MNPKPIQSSMFTTQDLPLFSGTAPRAEPDDYQPMENSGQLSMVSCRWCQDTGYVAIQANGNRHVYYCECAAGEQARTHQQRA